VVRERSASRSGFSLIEAIIAIVIVGIVLAAVVPAFIGNLRINTDNEARTGAVAAAQTVLDQFRVRPKSDWPTSGSAVNVDSHGRTYAVLVAYAPFCQGGICFTGAELIDVEVSYGGRTRYTVSTVFTALD